MSQDPNDNNRPLAFFDFDGTLTTGDSLMPFLKFVTGTPAYYAKLALVSPVLAAYSTKLLRNDIAKQIVLKQYLAGYHIDDLFELGQRFSEEVIPTMLRPEGMGRLRWHQEQGHECVLVSASIDVYLTAWAKQELFSKLICTALQKDNRGFLSGEIEGENCHGEVKAKRIKSLLKSKAARMTFAYGDTSGDLPMLYSVEKGYMLKSQGFRKCFIEVRC